MIVATVFTMNWSRQKRDNPLKVGNEDSSQTQDLWQSRHQRELLQYQYRRRARLHYITAASSHLELVQVLKGKYTGKEGGIEAILLREAPALGLWVCWWVCKGIT
jgi:restriction endonuclease